MIKATTDLIFKGLEIVLVLLLASMVVMVFSNVVLRYGFNSGITMSEELSRYFFVWLTFLGAIVTFRENSHLGVDILLRMLRGRARMICYVAGDLLIIFCCAIFFWGTWVQAPVNATMESPVVGVSMLWVYGVGFLTSIGIGILATLNLVGTIRHGADARFAESELDGGLSLRERVE
jgi:TRAP-type C4-dicarboxylate transport system permease small subunit